ncbi:MAG: hypothetical protein QM734_08230 [Cyclobacteriaceae bacterium]
MEFQRVAPANELTSFVECFWQAESNESKPECVKIIPDGFPEIIFHFGDPYRIRFTKHWSVQSKSLFGGQLKHFFFLENTGTSDVFGIKLKPTAPTHLFKLSIHKFTNRVVDLNELPEIQKELSSGMKECTTLKDRVAFAENLSNRKSFM